ncbi:C2 calcium/lipid-binding plant phosphoribosyltransferase family protein [Euphorbia peplus]|nr:C2 calcium/lipid-binding plant phosphoribosyltransferase family protein [Euphorbia peplus]
MSKLKLGVEVVSFHADLIPKDGQGSTSAFVELHFDNQKFRTTTKQKDLNPVWNEIFFFNISDPKNLHNLTLEAYIYNHGKQNKSKSFLGKVCLTGTSFVARSDAVVLHYPLENQRVVYRAKGELALKVFVTDNPEITSSSNPLPATDSSFYTNSHSSQASVVENSNPDLFTTKNEKSHQLRDLPNTSKPETVDYALKETSPSLGGGKIVGGRFIGGDTRILSGQDLVEQISYLYVRVVKARDLPSKDMMGSLDPFVEVRVGNYIGFTKYIENQRNPEWNQLFAFARERMQSSVLEVVVKDKDLMKDDLIGSVKFDMNEIPSRVPPDSSFDPEWYRLEDKQRVKGRSELMLAVWYGTQADEAFPDAWHSDDVSPSSCSSIIRAHIRSKVYNSPRLCYVRINVIEAQDLIIHERNRSPDAYVTVQIGNQVLKTKMVQTQTTNTVWNEDLMFVVAEPFEEHLVLTVKDHIASNKDENMGMLVIPLSNVERRVDDRMIPGRWFHLQKPISDSIEEGRLKKDKFSSRVHLRIALDEGYHVLDESTHYSGDFQPMAKQLRKPSIGVLDLGILNCDGLCPMKLRDGKGTSDTYCVAKYGHKWIRTRTIMNSLNPKYNEQYNWEVYDPATVLTIGVFDNNNIGRSNGTRDSKIGKVRIRLSTLEAGHIYTHSYPLLHLHPSGVKKMGELHLAIRFSYKSLANTMFLYTRPLLPKMHYVRPVSIVQHDMLRHQAIDTVAARLSRAEPPLRKEIVEYMYDTDSDQWSMRKSKVNFFRLMSVFSGLIASAKWFGEVCVWKNPVTTVLAHLLLVMPVCFPELILPAVFLYMFLRGLWNYRFRPRYPPHMNIMTSCAEPVNYNELDEEFDTFPTTRNSEIVRMRYDEMRRVAGRIQNVVGDVATQGERIQALLGWRDPRGTAMFVMFCLMASVLLYATPYVLFIVTGFYLMRHPRFRGRTPSVPINFFRRLPSRIDNML